MKLITIKCSAFSSRYLVFEILMANDFNINLRMHYASSRYVNQFRCNETHAHTQHTLRSENSFITCRIRIFMIQCFSYLEITKAVYYLCIFGYWIENSFDYELEGMTTVYIQPCQLH